MSNSILVQHDLKWNTLFVTDLVVSDTENFECKELP